MNLNTQPNFEFLLTAHRRMKKRIKTEVVGLFSQLGPGGELTRAHAEMFAKFSQTASDVSLEFSLPLTIAPDASGLVPHKAKLTVTDMAFDGSQPTGGGHFFEFMLELRDDQSARCHYSHHRVSKASDWVKAGKEAGDALYFWLLTHVAPGRTDLKPLCEELQWSQPTEDETAAAAAPAPDASLEKKTPRWASSEPELVAMPTETESLVTVARPPIRTPGPFEGTKPTVTHGVSSARHFSSEELVSEQDKIWDSYWVPTDVVELEVPRAVMQDDLQASVGWALTQARQLAAEQGVTVLRLQPVHTPEVEEGLEEGARMQYVGGQWIYLQSSDVLAVREEVPTFPLSDSKKYRYSVYGMEDGTYVDLLEKADLSFWMPERHVEEPSQNEGA